MRRGQVLIEACLALLLLILPTFFFHLELIRASQLQIFMRHACFKYVRARSLGASETRGRQEIYHLGNQFFPHSNFEKWIRSLNTEVWYSQHRLHARLQRRYQSWFPYFQSRFQMTKVCSFSF